MKFVRKLYFRRCFKVIVANLTMKPETDAEAQRECVLSDATNKERLVEKMFKHLQQ